MELRIEQDGNDLRDLLQSRSPGGIMAAHQDADLLAAGDRPDAELHRIPSAIGPLERALAVRDIDRPCAAGCERRSGPSSLCGQQQGCRCHQRQFQTDPPFSLQANEGEPPVSALPPSSAFPTPLQKSSAAGEGRRAIPRRRPAPRRRAARRPSGAHPPCPPRAARPSTGRRHDRCRPCRTWRAHRRAARRA